MEIKLSSDHYDKEPIRNMLRCHVPLSSLIRHAVNCACVVHMSVHKKRNGDKRTLWYSLQCNLKMDKIISQIIRQGEVNVYCPPTPTKYQCSKAAVPVQAMLYPAREF